MKNVEFLRVRGSSQIETATGVETVVGQSPVNVALALSARPSKENARDRTVVGVLSATDPEGKAVDVSRSRATRAARSSIEGNSFEGQAGPLDFETGASHTVTVEAQRCATAAHAQRTLVVAVERRQRGPEERLPLEDQHLREGRSRNPVGALSASDPEGNAVTFSLKSNPGGLFKLYRRQAQPGEGPRLREGAEPHGDGPSPRTPRASSPRRRSPSTWST